MSYEEFRRRVDTLCNILVGAVPSPAGQIDQITYALMYKFMNDRDDKAASYGGKRSYFVGDYERYSWNTLMSPSLGAHERLELYRQAIQTMAKNDNIPELFRSIYQNAFLPFNSANVLTLFLKEIDHFTHSDADDIGDVYEYLLQKTGAQGDVGQFRTPRHIIKFIVEAVNPTKTDSVLDPAVGTAGFLIAAYNHVKSQHDGKDTEGNSNDEKRLSADELDKIHHNYRGFDIDPTMVRTAKVNMYLHGFKTPDIINHDSLSSEDYWNDRYDVILANPPFMTPKGGIQPHKKFGISANRAEVLFVDYIASHLKPTGRAGIVVPEGIIFQSGKAYKELRKNLVENYLYAVVSLPAGVFNPYAGVKTSVLLLDKELAKQRDEILFVKVENDGYSLSAQRRPIAGNQFPEALEVIEKFKAGEEVSAEFAHAVPRREIAESGDYNLSGDRYRVNQVLTHGEWPMVELGQVLDYEQPTKYIVESTDYDDSYETPVLTAGKSFILGHTNEKTGIFEQSKLPVIIFDDFTTATKLVNFPFKVKSSAMKILLPKDSVDIRYVYYIMQKLNFSPIEHKRFWISEYSKFRIPLPPIEIQREIVAELDGYQKIIDAAQAIVKTYKPTIKINPEWKTVKLGDKKLFDIQSGGTPSSKEASYWDGDNNWVTLVDLPAENFITQLYSTKRKITDDGIKNSAAKLLPIGTVLVSTRATIGRVAIAREETSTNQGFKNIVIKDAYAAIPEYVALAAKMLEEKMKSLASGGTFSEISKTTFETLSMPLPSLEEQNQIVAELETEQNLIDANKKLIETMQQKIKSKIAEVWGD